MKFFVQKKAGVTFFQSETLSLGIRKNHVEYAFKLKSGNHGIVNMMPVEEGAILFTYWENALTKIDSLLPKLMFKEGQCENYRNILNGLNPDAYFTEIKDPDSGGNTIVLARIVKCNNQRSIIEMAAYTLLVDKARKLLDESLSLYIDLLASGIPEITTAALNR